MPKQAKAPDIQKMGAEHRLKIANSNVLKYLIDHAEGEREMGQTQVTAAIALMKKILPDMQTTALTDSDGGSLKAVFETIYERRKD